MCDLHGYHAALPALAEDEYMLGSARVREFVGDVREGIERADSPRRACELISPLFSALLADRDWLPAAYQAPATQGGMGGGIGQWLIFRARSGRLLHAAGTARRRAPGAQHLRAHVGVDSPAGQRHRLQWRHTYDEQTGEASPFRSGYVNAECVN